MTIQPTSQDSIVACVNKQDGTILKVGTAARMIGPAVVDPSHLMFGAGCGDWGVCIYLTIADAARLKSELDRLIVNQTQRG